jgi:uncharacterized SAM-binding protein YcdF (DUF218 family)
MSTIEKARIRPYRSQGGASCHLLDPVERPVAAKIRPRRLWPSFAFVVGLVAIGGVAFMWPRDDVPSDPDAIVVLGGVGGERIELGMALRERYEVPIVLSASAWGYGFNRGLRCEQDGVICVRPASSSTRGEAHAIAALAEREGWRRVTVATTDFHTTRARVLFRQCLRDRVDVVGAPPHVQRGAGTHAREALGTLAALTVRRAC